MYQVHDWAEVRRLDREGLSKRAIARRLAMSRTTVYRLLALSEPPAYEREPAASLLDAFKGAVLEMLREDASVPATVIREHLQRDGYGGGITILKDYLASVRPQFTQVRDFGRTTYLPGELLQADWWDTGVDVPVGKGAKRRAQGLVTTLPFSAAHAVVYAHSQTTADAVPALWGCLERLGGVPAKLVVDNDASFVVRRGRARPRPVDELAGLLGTLAMGCIVLPPRRPQSKGSVERAELAPLPGAPPATERRLEVRVSRDGFVRVAGVDYSLPPGLAGRRVAVRLGLSELAVFCEAREVARHARSYVPADVVRDAAHMSALAAAQEAQRRLRGGEPELPAVDLARYDALLGVCS